MLDRANSASKSETLTNDCSAKHDGFAPPLACDASPHQRPQFTLRFIALATTLIAVWAALWPITSLESRGVLAVIVLTYLFGCVRTRRSVGVMLPAVYVPQLGIFLIQDYPWSEYRWMWAKMFWQLPGIVPQALVRQSWMRGESWPFATMALFAGVIWLTAVALGRLGGWWLWITAGGAFALSFASARIEQILFRM